MNIVRAKAEDASTLSTIAFAAKRHWRYAERWREIWRDTLTVRPEFVVAHEPYAAVAVVAAPWDSMPFAAKVSERVWSTCGSCPTR